MSFLDDVVFPTEINYGSSGGPSFASVIQRTPAGRVSVIQRVADPASKWSVRWKRQPQHAGTILSFVRVTEGAAHGFRFLDFNDYSTTPEHIGAWSASTSSHRHEIGVGDGSTTRFPLVKTYSYGSSTKTRRIRKPMRLAEAQAVSNLDVLSSLLTESDVHAVWLNSTLKTVSTHYSIDYETGEIVFVSAPTLGQVVEWAGYFMVPARFGPGTDEKVTLIAENYGERSFDELEIEEIVEATANLVPERMGMGSSYFIEEAAATQRVLSLADGEFVLVDADATSPSPFPLKLPVVATWMQGGAWFRIVNVGGSKNVQVQDSAGSGIVTLSAGDTVEMRVGINSAGTGSEWRAV